jgi:AraC-like DNA-binding protein
MDPLSEVLSLVKTSHYMSGALEAGGAWCVHFPEFKGVRFYAAVQGHCSVAVEGIAAPFDVQAGDCLLFPSGQPFILGTDLSLPAMDALSIFPQQPSGQPTKINGGGDFFGIAGLFTMTGEHVPMLLGSLPVVFNIRAESDRAVLRWALERLRHELQHPQPGSTLFARQLATMVLIQALRLHISQAANHTAGWLFALADARMGQAIGAIHNDPGRKWTVQELATRAGMSRTSFAVRFKETVGQAPMDYLTHWRMLLAGDRLCASSESIAQIAASLGYESESAFSTAFKRVMGCWPRQYPLR